MRLLPTTMTLLVLCMSGYIESMHVRFQQLSFSAADSRELVSSAFSETSSSTLAEMMDAPMNEDAIATCGNPDDILKLEILDLLPDPPRRGQKLRIHIKGVLSETIVQGSYMDVIVKLQFLKLINKRFDLCEQLLNVNEKCPIAQGPLDIVKEVDLPSEMPMVR